MPGSPDSRASRLRGTGITRMVTTRLADTHRRKSIRLRGYDYTRAGAYFVTICTKGRACLFGEVVNDEVHLSAAGAIVQDEWLWTPVVCPYMHLDAFVIMPNHFHGTIVLDPGQGTACHAPTMERFGVPVDRSLPTIIRAFKSASTREINRMTRILGVSVWQRRFCEPVIRDDRDLERIRAYIVNNPSQWPSDVEHPVSSTPDRPREVHRM